MADDALHICSICKTPAYSANLFIQRSKLDGDQELYDIGCTNCGEYRISADSEKSMGKQSDTRRAALLQLIKTANSRGQRYCANDGREIPLSSLATPRESLRVSTSPPAQTPAPRLGE